MVNITQTYLNELFYQIVGCAIEVHKELGPGLLESVYQSCLVRELMLKGFEVKTHIAVPVSYKGLEVNCDLRLDILVEDLVVVELKSVETMLPLFTAQLLTYMNLLEAPFGILFNFNTTNIYHDGQKTYVNELYRILNE